MVKFDNLHDMFKRERLVQWYRLGCDLASELAVGLVQVWLKSFAKILA